jgi:hypothetical protein
MMKKILYFTMALLMPVTFAMENGTQRDPNEVDCWQKYGLNIPNLEISCRLSANGTDVYPVIEQTINGQKKELKGMSHQTYNLLFKTINGSKLPLEKKAPLYAELKDIVNRLPYSEVVFWGLTEEIKDKLHVGDLRVIMPGVVAQDYPQFFADKDHKKIAGGFLNGITFPILNGRHSISFQEKMNQVLLAEIPDLEKKVNALPQENALPEVKLTSLFLKPHILIPAGIIAAVLVGVFVWKKFFHKKVTMPGQQMPEQRKKSVKKKVRFNDEPEVRYI